MMIAVLARGLASVCVASMLIASGVTVARGQGASTPTVWSLAASPTTQDLNAVAAAPSGSFVAVGNAGAVLESSDGVHWFSEVSGTTQSLYSVISAGNLNHAPLWVAVGAAGTLLTSPDGVTWTARNTGTSADLRGVAYSADFGAYLAVGAGGTAVTSGDGIAWVVVQLKTTASLNAVVAVPQAFEGGRYFLIVGANGTVIADETPSSPVAPIASGTTQDFLAAVVYEGISSGELLDDGALALGQLGATGTYAYLTGDFPIPVWTLNPTTSAVSYVSAASAIINGAEYGVALTSAGSVMVLSGGVILSTSVFLPSGATYSGLALGSAIVVVGGKGTIWTNSTAAGVPAPSIALAGSSTPTISFIAQTITLSVPTVAGATYQWFQNGNPIAASTNASLVLANIQLSATGTFSVAVVSPTVAELPSTPLNVKPFPDYSPGLVDSSFVASVVNPNTVTPLPNGEVVVNGNQLLDLHGNLLATTGFYEPNQVIAQPDGKWIDVGEAANNGTLGIVRYKPDGSVDSSFSIPSTLLDYSDRLALLPNGQFLLLTTPSPGLKLIWYRLNSNGSVDATFPPQSLSVGNALAGIGAFSVDATGRVYVGILNSNDTPQVFRLAANLLMDPTFSVAAFSLPASGFSQPSVTQLQATPQGVLYAAVSGGSTQIGLLEASGVPDPGYATQLLSSPFILQSDGTVIVLNGSVSAISALCGNLVRFTPTGQVDASYGGRLVGDPSFGVSNSPYGVSNLHLTPLANGQIMLSGSFNSLNLTQTKNLGRITPNTNYAATHLVNASVRGTVAATQPLTMAGYLNATGAQTNSTAPVLFRASGPVLASFGISNGIANPLLTVLSAQGVVAANSGWSTGGQASAITSVESLAGAFPFAPNSNDAAWTGSIGAGPFFLQVTNGNASGVTLAEAYDTGSAPTAASDLRVTNFSCLDTTTPGNGQLTLGFVVAGPDVKTFLIRAVGPGLSAVNVAGPGILAAPVLTLYLGPNAIASNQNINTLLNNGEAYTDAALVGAFPLPVQSPDSALVVALPQGAYTAVASGANGTSGTVLLEVYEIP